VTLTVSINPIDLSREDREFVFGLIDQVKDYEERRALMARTGAEAGQEE